MILWLLGTWPIFSKNTTPRVGILPDLYGNIASLVWRLCGVGAYPTFIQITDLLSNQNYQGKCTHLSPLWQLQKIIQDFPSFTPFFHKQFHLPSWNSALATPCRSCFGNVQESTVGLHHSLGRATGSTPLFHWHSIVVLIYYYSSCIFISFHFDNINMSTVSNEELLLCLYCPQLGFVVSLLIIISGSHHFR